MTELRLQMLEGAFAALRMEPAAFADELRIAAAVLWYDRRLVSQGRAAEIAGLSRAAFIDALSRYGVTPFQVDAEELVEEGAGLGARGARPVEVDVLGRFAAFSDDVFAEGRDADEQRARDDR